MISLICPACRAPFDMVTSGSIRQALDLDREVLKTRERYKARGSVPHRPPAGRGRRRLRDARAYSWNHHIANFPALKVQLPAIDRGLANLVQDLHESRPEQRCRDDHVGRVLDAGLVSHHRGRWTGDGPAHWMFHCSGASRIGECLDLRW
jgi:hypothetical protein